jgi:hypothetical protein
LNSDLLFNFYNLKNVNARHGSISPRGWSCRVPDFTEALRLEEKIRQTDRWIYESLGLCEGDGKTDQQPRKRVNSIDKLYLEIREQSG